MFWRFGIQGGSTIDPLLDDPNVSLEAILGQADILQEVKSKNPKLIEYLIRHVTITKLLTYVTKLHQVTLILPNQDNNNSLNDIDQDTELNAASTFGDASSDDSQLSLAENVQRQENLRVRYPYLAAEIFSTDIFDLLEAVFDAPNAFQELITILDLPVPLDPYQAAYWSKIMSNLLIRLTEPTLVVLKREKNLIPRLVKHAMDNANLMDFLLKLVGVEELPAGRAEGSSQWLYESGLVDLLVGYLDPVTHVPDTHGTASAALLDMVAMVQAVCVQGERMESNLLVCELKSERIVSLLVKRMLDPTAPRAASALVHTVALFVELIRRNSADMTQMFQQQQNPNGIGGSEGSESGQTSGGLRVPMNLCAMIRALCLRLPDIQILLLNNAFGTRDLPETGPPAPGMARRFPLGQARLRLCELLAELLRCAIEEAVMDPEDEAAEVARISQLDKKVMIDDKDKPDPSSLETFDDVRAGLDVNDQETDVISSNSAGESSPTSMALSTEGSTNMRLTPPSNKVNSGKNVTISLLPSSPTIPRSQYKVGQTAVPFADRKAALSRVYGEELQAALRQAFVDTRILVAAMDLFFFFPWNNLLHGIVYDMVLQVLNGPTHSCLLLAMTLLKDGQLMRRIPRAQRLSDYEAEQPKGVRLGYMGHVMLIADVVTGFLERAEGSVRNELSDQISAEDWVEYANRTLPMAKERESKPLGGIRPPGMAAVGYEYRKDLNDDDNNVMEVAGGVGSEQFSRYLCQQITGDWPDKFGASQDKDDDADIDADWGGALMASSFRLNLSTEADSSPPSSPLEPNSQDISVSMSSSLSSVAVSPRISSPNVLNKNLTDIDDVTDMGPGWVAEFGSSGTNQVKVEETDSTTAVNGDNDDS